MPKAREQPTRNLIRLHWNTRYLFSRPLIASWLSLSTRRSFSDDIRAVVSCQSPGAFQTYRSLQASCKEQELLETHRKRNTLHFSISRRCSAKFVAFDRNGGRLGFCWGGVGGRGVRGAQKTRKRSKQRMRRKRRRLAGWFALVSHRFLQVSLVVHSVMIYVYMYMNVCVCQKNNKNVYYTLSVHVCVCQFCFYALHCTEISDPMGGPIYVSIFIF